MTFVAYLVYAIMLILAFAFVAHVLKTEARRYVEFDLVARSLLEDIDKEASKKNIKADSMILTALRKVLNDLKSL